MTTPADGIQEPYLDTIIISTFEHIKFYNKEIFGLLESDRHDFTRYKWTDVFQELEDAVSTFVFKAAVLIFKSIDAHNAPTEIK